MYDNNIIRVMGRKVRNILYESGISIRDLQEMRMRVGKPLIVISNNQETVFSTVIRKEDLEETLQYISNYSIYAFENEMRQGFITVEGGHRIGITGQVLIEDGKVKKIKHISSMNIRISHEIIGCADIVFPYIAKDRKIHNTLIISPPRCGKTTLLRDLIRQISDGNSWVDGNTVGVVDERSELGGCYLGVPQNQLGIRTDVLDCCPKSEGMMMLVRSMAPEVIAVDEIGKEEDVKALEYVMCCGCNIIATVHGTSRDEIQEKPALSKLISMGCFERFIVLHNVRQVGNVVGIYNLQGENLLGNETIC